MNAPKPPPCDLLLFTSTQVEWEVLQEEATKRGHAPTEARFIGIPWLDLGTISGRRVLAVKTRMGTLDYGAAAYCAMIFSLETQASLLIAVGMAFGVSPQDESIGDVLVASHVILYDRRVKKTTADASITTEYQEKSRRAAHAPSIQRAKQLEKQYRSRLGYRVHIGQLMSGSALIQSTLYRQTLVDRLERLFPAQGPIIGGEMEAGGVLVASNPQEPRWMIIKGISDFANERRATLDEVQVRTNQRLACANAVDFMFKHIAQESS